MKVKLRQILSLLFLLAFCHITSVACSSSEAQPEEQVDANGEGEEGDGQAAQADASQDAGDEEGEDTANAASQNSQANATQGQAGDQVAAGPEQQGDLQEIIDEMNSANGQGQAAAAPTQEAAATPPAQNAAAATMQETAAPVEGQATPAAAAATPAPQAASAQMPGLPEMGSKMSYIVQKGDTLAKIAAKVYGDTNKWNEIASFSGLSNPRLIYPGDVVYYQLTEQTSKFASAYESVPRSEVQVQQGDTLSTIAGRVLGDSSSWKTIWRQNDNIDDPDKLTAGSTVFYIAPGALQAAVEKIRTQFQDAKDEVKRVFADVDAAKSVDQPVSDSSQVNSVDQDMSADFAAMDLASLDADLVI